MNTEIDFLKKALGYAQTHDFKNAVTSLIGVGDDNSEAFDEILGVLVKLFSGPVVDAEKMPELLQEVHNIYEQNKDNIKELKEKANAFLAKFGKSEAIPAYAQELGDISALSDAQLKKLIDDLKKQQQDLLKGGHAVDQAIGGKLQHLLEEQNKRLGYKTKTDVKEKDVEVADSHANNASEASSWFVTPSDEELEHKANVSVACGSPTITVLRERYKLEYKLGKIIDVNKHQGEVLSGDEDYEIKREKTRQRDFVSNYMDPSLVTDQDMCAYEIASEIAKGDYPKPACIVLDNDTFFYKFKSGYLKDELETNTGRHHFSIEGSIPGRIAIAINRKEMQSGRQIHDSYDILEFQNGVPAFYFYSSSGVSSLSNRMIKGIVAILKKTPTDLTIPSPAVIGDEMSAEELDIFIHAHKGTVARINEQQSNAASSMNKGQVENKQAVESDIVADAKDKLGNANDNVIAPPKTESTLSGEVKDAIEPADQNVNVGSGEAASIDDDKKLDEKQQPVENQSEIENAAEENGTAVEDKPGDTNDNAIAQPERERALNSEVEDTIESVDQNANVESGGAAPVADDKKINDETEPSAAAEKPNEEQSDIQDDAVPENTTDVSNSENDYVSSVAQTEQEVNNIPNTDEEEILSNESKVSVEEDSANDKEQEHDYKVSSNDEVNQEPVSEKPVETGQKLQHSEEILGALFERLKTVEEIAVNSLEKIESIDTRVKKLEAATMNKKDVMPDDEKALLRKRAEAIKKSLEDGGNSE